MSDRIQFRRDTAARWAQFNPFLLEGEIGVVLDNPNQYKVGDGVHYWNDLPLRGFNGNIVNQKGQSEDSVMSQKAVTDAINSNTAYLYCTSNAGDDKVVQNTGFDINNGIRLLIKMQYANTKVSDVTLQVGATDAKPIIYNGSVVTDENTWDANDVLDVYYDGNNYQACIHGSAQFATGEKVKDVAIDDEPTPGSDNLVKSGGVFEQFNNLKKLTYDSVSSGVLVSDGTIDTVVSPSNKIYKYNIPENTTDIYITYNSDFSVVNPKWAVAWMVDSEENMLSCISVDANPQSATLFKYQVPNNATQVWVGIPSHEIEVSYFLKEKVEELEQNVSGIQQDLEEIEEKISPFVHQTYSDLQLGLLKRDGTIDTTTLSTHLFAKYPIKEGIDAYYLSGYYNLSEDYSVAWMVDSNGNMLSYLNIPFQTTFTKEKFVIPANAVELWVNESSYEVEYIGDIKQDINDIKQDINDIKQDIAIEGKLDSDSQGTGWLKNDGTIATSPSGGKYNIFNLPENIDKFYLTVSGVIVSPNVAWSLVWIADSNGNCLNFIPAVSGNVPNVSNLLIDISNYPAASKIYVTKCSSCYLEYSTNEKINEKVSELDTRVTNLENEEDLNNTNQWKGKKIIWLGTSIPYGQSAADGGRAAHPYPNQIAERLECTVVNNASPGLAVEGDYDSDTGVWSPKQFGSLSLTLAEYSAAGQSSPGVKCYENSMLGQNADLYVFDCEPNNSDGSLTDLNNFNIAQWKYSDNSTFASHRNTFVGAIIYLLDRLWTEKPNAKVVFVGEFGNSSTYQTDSIHDAAVTLCEKFSIHYIDLWNKLYYNPLNKSQYINTDNVHPKQAGYDRMANILTNELLLIS